MRDNGGGALTYQVLTEEPAFATAMADALERRMQAYADDEDRTLDMFEQPG